MQLRTAAERQRMIEAYKSSGLSVMMFAQSVNMSKSTFYGWLKKSRGSGTATSIKMARVVRRMPVQRSGARQSLSASPLSIEIGRARIHINDGFNKITLTQILEIITAHATTQGDT